jgi:hypothetical protein
LRRCCRTGLFEPAPGQVFLAAELRDLPLRALAAVCRHRFGVCKLAELFSSGADPYAVAAADLARVVPEATRALGASGAPAQGLWRKLAQVLLATVPTGLGPECAHAAVRREPGLEGLGLAQVKRLQDGLLEDIFPELGAYLRDDTLEVLAGNLQVEPHDLASQLIPCRYPHGPSLPELREWFWRGEDRLPPERRERLQTLLRVRNTNESLRPLILRPEFSKDLYAALFGRRVVTRAGRARGGLLFSESRRAEYLDLADDAAKAALFTLAAAGHRVAAFAEGTILLEVPATRDLTGTTAQAQSLAHAAVEEVLNPIPAGCEARVLASW